ncbi:MAG: UDP-N-acetylmuramoyl-L-alanyl-D-glutamate--2,6-diaminopimelate ligase [Oscillospiraceae bacterium]|jgi:UDP-N-acetylmuramoyl-L-alanyl-D-glutamate--2,6-diaminopimelate ligase|nr:UDP-N-acetylmuramoyl-L-alanyl-D-glutamate--2,6-diaminopimelate ligase [Oscillospiraceae bacterium]
MTLFTLLKALDTLQTNAPSLDSEVGGVHNDTRRMKAGDLFVAIAGNDTDGHCYIQDAIQKGASMIVSESPLDPSVPHVVVPNGRAALAQLAACMAGYPAKKLKIIGVTGTKGKTSVTHIIKGLLERVSGEKAGLIGTAGNFAGAEELLLPRTAPTTPDAVTLHGLFSEMAARGCAYCVMEVSSIALDQHRVEGVRFAAGAFLNLQHDHLDYHDGMESYFAAKSRLFSQCDRCIVNIDDPYGKRLADSLPDALTCSAGGAADFTAQDIELLPGGVSFTATSSGEAFQTSWNTPGLFSARNALTALACARALGYPLGELCRVLPDVPPVIGRMETVPAKRGVTVVIDYAHTPESITSALTAARGFTAGKLTAVFGCGGDRDKTKRPLMGAAAQKAADRCIVTSDNPRTEDPGGIIRDILAGMEPGVRAITDRREAIRVALAEAGEGDTVMLLGKGQETYQEINGVKHPMDEREIVRELML